MEEKDKNENELIALIKSVWDGRKLIIIITSIVTVVGIIAAVEAEKEYSASTTMVPHVGQGRSLNSNSLRGLAFLAGFNLNTGSGQNEISPALYPDIVRSVPFQLELAEMMIYSPDLGKEMKLKDYLTVRKPGVSISRKIKQYTIGLPKTIARGFSKPKPEEEQLRIAPEADTLRRLTSSQFGMLISLRTRIQMSTDPVSGTIQLSVTMGEAIPATQVAVKTQQLLQETITKFKTKRALEQLEFTEQLYLEKKALYEQAQEKLADFTDRNRIISTASARNEETRIRSEYDLAFQVFSELAKQYESKKIEAQESAPSFSVIHPVITPNIRSAPNRIQMVIVGGFLGVFIGLLALFARNGYRFLKARL